MQARIQTFSKIQIKCGKSCPELPLGGIFARSLREGRQILNDGKCSKLTPPALEKGSEISIVNMEKGSKFIRFQFEKVSMAGYNIRIDRRKRKC